MKEVDTMLLIANSSAESLHLESMSYTLVVFVM